MQLNVKILLADATSGNNPTNVQSRFRQHPASNIIIHPQQADGIRRLNETASHIHAPSGTRLVDDEHSDIAIHSVLRAIEDDYCFLSASTHQLKHINLDTSLTPLAEPSLLCMSAGSTGTPKIVRRTQQSWIRSFDVNAQLFGIERKDRYAILGKLRHSLPLYASIEALHLGADVHFVDQLRPLQQLGVLEQSNISIVYATPTQLRLLLIASAQGNTHLPDVRLVLCGGGKLDRRTLDNAQKLMPNCKVHEFYGASETSFITIADAHTPDGSVGCAYPDVSIRIIDDDSTGFDNSGVGEISVSSPYVFCDYIDGHDSQTHWVNDHLCFGEMGKLDNQGNLTVYGRRNRMVTVGDVNVFPEHIEAHICMHPAVAQCAVVSTPDRLRGNRLIAFVQCATAAPSPADIVRFLRDTGVHTGALKSVQFVDNLPMLASGKPNLENIRQWAATL